MTGSIGALNSGEHFVIWTINVIVIMFPFFNLHNSITNVYI